MDTSPYQWFGLFSARENIIVVVRTDPVPEVHLRPRRISVVVDHIHRPIPMGNTDSTALLAMSALVRVIERMIAQGRMLRIVAKSLKRSFSKFSNVFGKFR